jgi:hypothetical protein
MFSFSPRQLLSIVLFCAGNVCLAAFEVKTNYIMQSWGAYAHAGALTYCFTASVLSIGLTYIYNYFCDEFAADEKRKKERTRVDAYKSVAANKDLWQNVAKMINKQAWVTATLSCSACVVRSDSGPLLSITYSVGQYQVGFDDIELNFSNNAHEKVICETIFNRYHKLYEHSGLRIGLQRYQEMNKK